MPKLRSKSARLFLLHISISLVVAVVVLVLTQGVLIEFSPLKRIELSLIDQRFQRRGPQENISKRSDVVIVEISQESFAALLEKWPWPRSYYTRLIQNLNRAGARAIGLDVIFSTQDYRDPHNDDEFRKALREAGNVVLAGKLEEVDPHGLVHRHEENYGNIFVDSSANVGLVNAAQDDDGVLRRYWPLLYDNGQQKRLPTFSMAVLNVYFHQPANYVASEDADAFSFTYLNKRIPAYDPTSFLINYYGPSGTFRRIKFADVLDDKDFKTVDELTHPGEETNTFDDPDYGYLTDGTFKDKIVLVGSTMPEEKDLFPTSIGQGNREGNNTMYGVEIHANVIQNVLDQHFIVRQPTWITALVVFGMSLFTFVFTAGLKAIRTKYSMLIELLGVAIVCAELFITYWIAVRLFIDDNFLADMTSPFFAIIVSYIGSTVYSYVTERRQKVLIKGMFSRYVNPTIVDELVSHPEKLRLGGERKELTVFFSDIENFTQISEKLPPEDLVAALNEYLSAMTAIILANNGTLDKYEGDAIVAFWGAPIPQADHALLACRSAVQMQRMLQALRRRWERDQKPLFKTRIGINTGDMIVGNMGGATRFDYTVMGDSVNLGARLESANKQYRTSIIISEYTYQMVRREVIARELDLLIVAGKTEPIRVYELLSFLKDGIDDRTKEFLDEYAEGLTNYRQRKWDLAIKKFTEALQHAPDDYPSQLYIERSRSYRETPPPDDWNGAFTLLTK